MRMCLCNADSQKCKKKGQQKVPILKKTTGLYASRSYYSMIHMRTWLACRRAVNKSWQSIIPGSLAGCRLWHNLLQHQPPAQQTSLDDLFRGRPGLQCGAESRAHPTQPEMLQLPRYQRLYLCCLGRGSGLSAMGGHKFHIPTVFFFAGGMTTQKYPKHMSSKVL